MKFSKKLLTALAVLMLAVLVLVSCDQAGNTDVNASLDDVTTEAPGGDDSLFMDPENIQISVSGEGTKKQVNFTVVRPESVSNDSAVVSAAQIVRDNIKKYIGTVPGIKDDFVKKGTEHDATTYEILIGATTYPQSREAAKNCGYGDYIIDVIDNKIVIMAYSDDCILKAANAFVNELFDGLDKENGVITLKKSEIAKKNTTNDRLSAIPNVEGCDFSAYYNAGQRTADKKTQCDELIFSDATPELFDAYVAKIAASGYTKYADHTMAESKFATFINDKYMLNVGFYDHYNEIRVIVESADAPKPEAENTYNPATDKVTTSQITMFGLEYYNTSEKKTMGNGLSILIRLEDGRFIVVDGGFNRTVIADKLISTIKEQSKDYTTKPVIAAWIVTHAHGDHNGMINAQYNKFSGIKVERFLLNFMAESERTKAISAIPDNWDSPNEGNNYTKTWTAAEALNSTIYKIHVGQVFHFADLQMEVMYTIESFGPKICNALNTTSTVIKMTFTNDGKKTTYLCTGDATGNGMQISAKMFGDYMHCDIVQVCHHGYSTWGNDSGMIEAYKKVNATLLIWPQGITPHSSVTGKGYNNILFNVSNYRECYVAGAQGDVTVVKLPYNYEESNHIEVTCTGSCPANHHYVKKAS